MPEERDKKKIVEDIFEDPEARRNIVGLFDLLLKIDKRVNPRLYAITNKPDQEND